MKSNNQDCLVTRKRFSVNRLGNTKDVVTSKNKPYVEMTYLKQVKNIKSGHRWRENTIDSNGNNKKVKRIQNV